MPRGVYPRNKSKNASNGSANANRLEHKIQESEAKIVELSSELDKSKRFTALLVDSLSKEQLANIIKTIGYRAT